MAKVDKGDVFDVVRALLVAVLTSVLLVIILAVIAKFTDMDDKVIVPVNIALRIVAVAIGICTGVRHGRHGIAKGTLTGLMFAAITYIISVIVAGGFKASAMTLYDALASVAAGAVCGVITVNLRARSAA